MTILRFTVVLAAAAVLTACSDDPVPSIPPSGGAADATAGVASDCAAVAEASAQAQGDRVFVEAGGAQYRVDEVRLLADDRVLVETTVDQPELVGYPQVQFLSQCADGAVVLLGGYVPINGTFELLFTTTEGEAAGDISMVAP